MRMTLLRLSDRTGELPVPSQASAEFRPTRRNSRKRCVQSAVDDAQNSAVENESTVECRQEEVPDAVHGTKKRNSGCVV